MNIHILDTEPRPETLDDEPGMAEYALRNHDRPETIVCYLWLSVHQMPLMAKLLNSQAEKGWELGCAHGATFLAGQVAKAREGNPFATQTQVDGLFAAQKSGANFSPIGACLEAKQGIGFKA